MKLQLTLIFLILASLSVQGSDVIFKQDFENTRLVSGHVSGLVSSGLELKLTAGINNTIAIEENGEFKGVEVELGRQLGKSREIKGLPAGTKVVTTGAFYVAAEIAKGSFDAHNH